MYDQAPISIRQINGRRKTGLVNSSEYPSVAYSHKAKIVPDRSPALKATVHLKSNYTIAMGSSEVQDG